MAADVFGNLFPPIIMDFIVPSVVVAALFVYILYMFLKRFGYIDW